MYRAAAAGGMARAQLILAWRLAEGRGCDMDTVGSLLYLEDAVLSARKDSDAADEGASCLVGEGHGSMIDHGAGAPEPVSTKGFPQQPASALELFVRAAEAGHPAAKYQLGYLYENGVGIVEKDEYQAIEWYESAAACNFPAAEFALGNLFFSGNGVQEEIASAMIWCAEWAQLFNAGVDDSALSVVAAEMLEIVTKVSGCSVGVPGYTFIECQPKL